MAVFISFVKYGGWGRNPEIAGKEGPLIQVAVSFDLCNG